MLVNPVIRWIVLYFLITNVLVNAVDIFDMFNDIGASVTRKPNADKDEVETKQATTTTTTMKTIADQKKDSVSSELYKNRYTTTLSDYRNVVKYWTKLLPSDDAELYRVTLKLSPNNIARLKKFAANSKYDEKEVINEVHAITEILRQNVVRIEEIIPTLSKVSWLERLRSFDGEKIAGFILLPLTIGSALLASIQVHRNFRRWFTTFFIFAFIISVFQNCYGLYLESLAKIDAILMKQLPKHCLSYSHGFFHTIKTALTRTVQVSHDECFEYQKALRSLPHMDATLMKGVSLTIAQIFITPLGNLGEKLSEFFAGLMLHVPVVALPIVFGFIGFFLFLLIVTHSRVSATLFGFLRIQASPKEKSSIDKKEDKVLKQNGEDSEKKISVLGNNIAPLEDGSFLSPQQSSSLSIEHQNQYAEVPSSNQQTDSEQNQNVPAQSDNEPIDNGVD